MMRKPDDELQCIRLRGPTLGAQRILEHFAVIRFAR